MEISRLDAGVETVQLAEVDVYDLTRGIVRARGWDSTVRVEGAPSVVQSDGRRLERIVANLVENAVEHGGEGVTVRVARDADRVTVTVTDRGPGIAAEDLPHVFERFYKADRSRSGVGSGLGLAIAAENAKLLGGRIEARSEPGRGARFTLTLPVAEPLPAGDARVAGDTEDEVDRHEGGDP
jgi:two-component system sensor histidine kinase MtrB